jgi:hypothetical protein
MKAKGKGQKAKVKRAAQEELKVLRAQRILTFALCLLPFTFAPMVLIFAARKM